MHFLRAVGGPAVALALAGSAAEAQIATVHTVDSGGVGLYSAVAYGTDSLPLISYYDATNGDLKVAHCADVACATSTKVTLDAGGNVGQHTSLAIGLDGRGVVSYLDVTNGTLKVAHCTNVACTTAGITSLAALGSAAHGTAIAVPPDGRPLIASGSGPGSALRIARCADPACTSATAVTHSFGGFNPSLAVGGDGLALFASDVSPTGPMGVRRCRDADCTASDPVPLFGSGFLRKETDGPDGGGTPVVTVYQSALTTGPDGLVSLACLVDSQSIFGTHGYAVRFARCAFPDCPWLSVGNTAVVGGNGERAEDPALAVGANGLPVVAATRFPGAKRLGVMPCSNTDCQGNAVDTVGVAGEGVTPSVAVSAAGIGLVAYFDETIGSLETAYLDGLGMADVSVTLSAFPPVVAPTGELFYRPEVSSTGPDVARGISVSVALPAGTIYEPLPSQFLPCTYDAQSHVATCPLLSDLGPGGAAMVPPTLAVAARVPLGGLPPPLVATATVSTSRSVDANLANNSASASVGTAHGVRVAAPVIREGDVGTTPAPYQFTLLPTAGQAPGPASLTYTTESGGATSGVDFLPASGALTLTPGVPTQTVNVSIVGDVVPEYDEVVRVSFSSLQGAVSVDAPVGDGRIVDDDKRGQVGHGTTVHGDLDTEAGGPFPPEDFYVFLRETGVLMAPPASWEFVVDAASGDLAPITLELLNLDFRGSPFQSATGPSSSVSLRMEWPDLTAGISRQLIGVKSGGCSADCDPDDVYRLRAYETTGNIPRFNNSATQSTVLILQNPTGDTVTGHVHFWSSHGQYLSPRQEFTLDPHASLVLDTSPLQPFASGTISVTHDAPYGVLHGKAVALEPSTGFSFDTPMTYRPK